MERALLSAALLASALCPIAARGQAPTRVDGVIDLVDQQVVSGTGQPPFRSEASRLYETCCPTPGGYGTFEEKQLTPVPSDGSIVTGGSVIAGSSGNHAARTASEANLFAWVRVARLEILGGSSKGGLTVRQMLVHGDLSCRNGRQTSETRFMGLEVSGQVFDHTPDPNTQLELGPYTVILNEQHPSATGLGLSVTGIHIIGPPKVPGSEPLDIRIASINDSLNCPGARHAPSPLTVTLRAVTSGQPGPSRPWDVELAVVNRTSSPCTLTSVSLWNPRPEYWRVSASSGPLGERVQDSTVQFGDGWIAGPWVLAPGKRLAQRFTLIGRKPMPITRPSGFLAEATCAENGTWPAAVGGLPTSR